MKILNSNKLNRRFMKDVKMKSSYVNKEVFEERLRLFDKEHGTLALYQEFTDMINSFENPNDYFNHVSKVINDIKEDIQDTANYRVLNSLDFNVLNKEIPNVPGKTIFTENFIDETYITLDMNKANYQILKFMAIEDNKLTESESYADFLSKYTDFEYLTQSKSLRQAIVGQLNPKRNRKMQKVILGRVMNFLVKNNFIEKDDVVLLLNDELTFRDNGRFKTEDDLKNLVELIKDEFEFDFSYEKYVLRTFNEQDGFLKEHFYQDNEVKGLSKFVYPAYLKHKQGLEIEDKDLYFLHDGMIARYMNVPSFELK